MSDGAVVTTRYSHLLRPEEVASRLGVTVNTLAIWRHYRRGPSFLKIGRQVRYPEELVNEFLNEAVRDCDPKVSRKPARA